MPLARTAELVVNAPDRVVEDVAATVKLARALRSPPISVAALDDELPKLTPRGVGMGEETMTLDDPEIGAPVTMLKI